MSPVAVVASVLMVVGVALALLGAAGLHRFPDVFARMHAATKPVTLGLACVLLGAALLEPDQTARTKLLVAAALQFITAPVGAHMIGRAAYRAGTELSPDTAVDELAGVTPAELVDHGRPASAEAGAPRRDRARRTGRTRPDRRRPRRSGLRGPLR